MRSLSLIALTFSLVACTTAASGVEVAPPIVMTVVVTSAAAGGTPDAGPSLPTTESATQPAEVAPKQYPAPFWNTVDGVHQEFERGFMIYLSDRKTIWIFETSGAWLAFDDTFKEGEPELDPNLTPPANFQQPKRGFGKVWRENTTVREALGWGLDYERPYRATVADFSIGVFDENGNYTPQSFIHTITALDGSLIHIDEATKIWSKP